MAKILYFHHYNDYSGSTKVLADSILSKYGNHSNVFIIVDNSNEGFLSTIGAKLINVPIIRYRGRAIPFFSQLIWIILGIVKALYYGRMFDVFYINTIIPMYGALVGKLLNKEIVYHIHEKYVNHSIKSRLAEYIFYSTKAKRLFVSNYVASKYHSTPGCETSIEYNKLSPDFLNKVTVVPLVSHTRDRVIMISSLQEGKGVNTFVSLAKSLPNITFTLILNCSRDEIIRHFGSSTLPNLRILEKQSNIHPFLREADLILNLSIPSLIIETFGITIVEGMAYGLPAVVPNVGGPTEIIIDGFNGFCVDTTDIIEISKAIKLILNIENYSGFYNNSLKRLSLFS